MRLGPRYVRLAAVRLAAVLLAPALVAALRPAPLAAQRRGDQARILISVMPGYVLGTDLWAVPGQSVVSRVGELDTFALSRSIRPALGLSFSGAYFPGDHLGFTGEAALVGLGYHDQCRVVHASGDVGNQSICATIDNAERAATAVVLGGGVILRAASRRVISPYLRLEAGLTLSNQSSVQVIGADTTLPSGEPAFLTLFPDEHNSRAGLAMVGGVGFTAALSPGYQLRWEFRDHMVGVKTVTDAAVRGGIAPPTKTSYKHLAAMFIGFDVVLERRRGRRY
jgi:hypothetical protein